VEDGRFRADLLDRLSFEVITLPPLRSREGDVEVLAEFFGRRMASECRWPGWPGFSEAAIAELIAYPWPGNVRELRNVVERAVYRWGQSTRAIDAIQFDPFASPWRPVPMPSQRSRSVPDQPAPPPSLSVQEMRSDALHILLDDIADLRGAVEAHELAILNRALERHRFNQRATAKALGLTYDQMRHCMKKHGLA
jgi:psp operon transcriptional activator